MLVYLITNQLNGKQYVGQTVQSLEKRWKRHCWESTLNRNSMAITKAIALYGIEKFSIQILEECSNQVELNAAEQKFIIQFNTLAPCGYNLNTGGKSKGHLSEETKRKIAASNRNRQVSDLTKKKLSESHKGWVPSENTREKWRKTFQGKKQDEKVVRKRAIKLAKTYTLISPEGFETTFTNMKEFCQQHNLSESKMNEVANSKRARYKGWQK
jgi:group I intron endonuclease